MIDIRVCQPLIVNSNVRDIAIGHISSHTAFIDRERVGCLERHGICVRGEFRPVDPHCGRIVGVPDCAHMPIAGGVGAGETPRQPAIAIIEEHWPFDSTQPTKCKISDISSKYPAQCATKHKSRAKEHGECERNRTGGPHHRRQHGEMQPASSHIQNRACGTHTANCIVAVARLVQPGAAGERDVGVCEEAPRHGKHCCRR